MSENNKGNNVTANEQKKETFVIGVAEHETFDHIMDAKYISSAEFCGIVSSVLSQIYADYEGCAFEIAQNNFNTPVIKLFFNHKDRRNNPDAVYACSKDTDDQKTKNQTLRSMRSYQNRLLNADKYFLTDEGKDGLSQFLIDNRAIFKQDGSVNWGKVVTEIADPQAPMGVPMQYTQVSSIDPVRLLELIYGKKDENDVNWIYGIRVMRSIPTYSMMGANVSANFMLAIERVCEPELTKLANSLGLNVQTGLNIIR